MNARKYTPQFGGPPIPHTPEVDRVASLPRRKLPSTHGARWQKTLSLGNVTCDCVAKYGRCLRELNSVQLSALEELHTQGGLLGKIGVGHGKTAIDILAPMVLPHVKDALLLIPAGLKRPFFETHYPQLAAHFRVPNLVGGDTHYPDRPTLRVVTYSDLQQTRNSALLTRGSQRYQLVILDECHNLKNPESARTRRFLRFMAANPQANVVAMSGTVARRSIVEYWATAALCLGKRSPLPLSKQIAELWGSAVDALPYPAAAGAMRTFCEAGEKPQDGYRRRIEESPGVVSTGSASVDCELYLSRIEVATPDVVKTALKSIELGVRPDGDEAESPAEIAQWSEQAACGFYYQWFFPRGEPQELVDRWREARKNWNREVRTQLENAVEGLDSPALWAAQADSGRWASKHRAAWLAVRDSVEPVQRPIWLSGFLLDACEAWAAKSPGLVWVSFREFGFALARRLMTHFYAGDGENPESEKGKRSVVLSIRACNAGFNLQHSYSRNLFAGMPQGGDVWNQALGRTHRRGQKADEVTASVFLHTELLRKRMQQALYDVKFQGSGEGLAVATLDLGLDKA